MTPTGNNQTKRYNVFNFFKDFSVGCVVLLLVGILVFVLVPLILFGVQIAFWLAVPVIALIAIIALTALLGNLISKGRKYRQDKQSRRNSDPL